MTEQEIIEKLMETHEEFKKLKAEHAQLEARLEEIYSSKRFFSTEEEVEIKSIKRRKLQLKDKMNEIIFMVKKGELSI
ncbi:MAG TPA: DUF465 domain-containing protein [Thermosulfidibacter takaii]|uniref:DUF465 domain-containing protein n=1 Tax=Thermosulfidibacter takaii TaxID=412593 RepID=A0A7C0U6W8_9BACT|nr:DUF465 domain-containing protein [Thermosulfidibacter takaii]